MKSTKPSHFLRLSCAVALLCIAASLFILNFGPPSYVPLYSELGISLHPAFHVVAALLGGLYLSLYVLTYKRVF